MIVEVGDVFVSNDDAHAFQVRLDESTDRWFAGTLHADGVWLVLETEHYERSDRTWARVAMIAGGPSVLELDGDAASWSALEKL